MHEENSGGEDQIELVSEQNECNSPLLKNTDEHLVMTRMSQEMG